MEYWDTKNFIFLDYFGQKIFKFYSFIEDEKLNLVIFEIVRNILLILYFYISLYT